MQTNKINILVFGAHTDDVEFAAYDEGFTASGYIGVHHIYQLT